MRFFDENIEALLARIPAPLLGIVPRLEQATCRQRGPIHRSRGTAGLAVHAGL
jgi:hypothetical protein